MNVVKLVKPHKQRTKMVNGVLKMMNGVVLPVKLNVVLSVTHAVRIPLKLLTLMKLQSGPLKMMTGVKLRKSQKNQKNNNTVLVTLLRTSQFHLRVVVRIQIFQSLVPSNLIGLVVDVLFVLIFQTTTTTKTHTV
jgi:hypothetical protein